MTKLEQPRLFGVPCPVLAAALLTVFLIAGGVGLRSVPVLPGEPARLAAGLTALETGDLRLLPEEPPLARLWIALPLRLGGGPRVDYEGESWTGRGILPGTTMTMRADAEAIGAELLGFPRIGVSPPPAPLVRGRVAQLVAGLLLGLVVWGWARELWGPRGALLSLFLYCLSPAMLGAARVVTPDLPSALLLTATLWSFWRFTQHPDWVRGLFVGLALAAALLVRLGHLLLIPVLVVVGLCWLWIPRTEKWERFGRGQLLVLVLAGALVVGWAGVWAGYGFRYLATPDETYQLDWEAAALSGGVVRDAVYGALDRRLLPQGYLYAIAHAVAGLGETARDAGPWYALPLVFATRMPPAFLALLAALVLVLAVRVDRLRSFDTWCLLLPAAAWVGAGMAVAPAGGLSLWVPVLPLLFVATGQLAWFARPATEDDEDEEAPRAATRVRVWLLAALLVAYAVSFLAAGIGGGPWDAAPGETAQSPRPVTR